MNKNKQKQTQQTTRTTCTQHETNATAKLHISDNAAHDIITHKNKQTTNTQHVW